MIHFVLCLLACRIAVAFRARPLSATSRPGGSPGAAAVPGDLPPEKLQEVDDELARKMYQVCRPTKESARGNLGALLACPRQAHFHTFRNEVPSDAVFENVDLGDVAANDFVKAVGFNKQRVQVQDLQFSRDGVELWKLEDAFMHELSQTRAIALLSEPSAEQVAYMEHNTNSSTFGNGAADVIERGLTAFLAPKYAHPIELSCSTSVKVRAASDKFKYDGSGHIPGNTLFHADYHSLDDAFDRLFAHQELWENPTLAPVGGVLVDVVNFWAPMKDEPVEDWMLGFVLPRNIKGDWLGVNLVVDVKAASLREADLDAASEVVYMKNMAWGAAYVFKASAKIDEQGRAKTVPFHGSFRVFPPTDYERRSVEHRCGVFKMSF